MHEQVNTHPTLISRYPQASLTWDAPWVIHFATTVRHSGDMKWLPTLASRLTVTVLFLTSAVAIIVRAVGALGDVQAVVAASDTPSQVMRFLATLPIWLLGPVMLVSFAYLIWSTVQVDLDRKKALASLTEANARAWRFQPEFLAYQDKISHQERILLEESNKLQQRTIALENEFKDLMESNGRTLHQIKISLLEENDKTLTRYLTKSQEQLTTSIRDHIEMMERHRLRHASDMGISPDDPKFGEPYSL